MRDDASHAHPDRFVTRHIGPREDEIREMLRLLGSDGLDDLMARALPSGIGFEHEMDLPPAMSEAEAMAALGRLAAKNRVLRSYIGLGYHGTIVPAVLRRNVLENPGWYTQYTPYQAEISQGRLEAMLNFQTLVISLTGLPVANASLLDEATAAAEAMHLCHAVKGGKGGKAFFVAADCHPQTIEVVTTRAQALGIEVVTGCPHRVDLSKLPIFGALVQSPDTEGRLHDYSAFAKKVHDAGALLCVGTDLLALTLLRAPGEWGADVAFGNSQRFGVPMGYGGPHAAFFATKDEFKRDIAGRLIGVSRDSRGKPALRLTLATREQHIRREKATSNICTAQVLLAVMAGMYAVYHGPEGLKRIATRVHAAANVLAEGVKKLGCKLADEPYFDTLRVDVAPRSADDVVAAALFRGINIRKGFGSEVIVALDETVGEDDLADLLASFAAPGVTPPSLESLAAAAARPIAAAHAR
jgi:glycine dehydrogenase